MRCRYPCLSSPIPNPVETIALPIYKFSLISFFYVHGDSDKLALSWREPSRVLARGGNRAALEWQLPPADYDHGQFGCACEPLQGQACELVGRFKLLLNESEFVPSFLRIMTEKPSLSRFRLGRKRRNEGL